MDPVPNPLLLRKSGSAGNRTRDFCICSQKLWPLDHRGGAIETMKSKGMSPSSRKPLWKKRKSCMGKNFLLWPQCSKNPYLLVSWICETWYLNNAHRILGRSPTTSKHISILLSLSLPSASILLLDGTHVLISYSVCVHDHTGRCHQLRKNRLIYYSNNRTLIGCGCVLLVDGLAPLLIVLMCAYIYENWSGSFW